MKFLRHRIADERVLRLISKWLAAGVVEDGKLSESGQGTPREHRYRRCWPTCICITSWTCGLTGGGSGARGNVVIMRFADDFIVGFQYQDDAERFLSELRERLAEFSLELHPEKTRLIEFGPYAAREEGPGRGEAGNVLFPGIPAHRPVTRGAFLDPADHRQEKDEGKAEAGESRDDATRHLPVPEQGRWLASVITGHQGYYAVPGIRGGDIPYEVTRHWRHALSRRSQKGRLTWERMNRIASR